MNFLLFFGFFLYFSGLVGIFLNRKNFILFLMCLELMFLGLITFFVCSSIILGDMSGQVFSLIIITVAAAESAIGLSLLVLYHQNDIGIDLETIDMIRF